MPNYSGQTNYTHSAQPTVGVLLCNLGTPDAPTPRALRRYLAEFLADPRLIELPRALWLPILHGIILNSRPSRSARAYVKVWTAEGSPLRVLSEQLCDAIKAGFAPVSNVTVALAMRYGQPSIRSALERLRAANVQQLLVLPLYPQYSGTSTGSVFDAVTNELQGWRWVPALRIVTDYHDNPAYISALANSIRDHWRSHGQGERLYFSFHGIPRKYFLAGDPYFCHCQATARLIAAQLDLAPTQWQVVFQSRFGRTQWLEPYADPTFSAAARAGVKTIDVVCPGFAVDCLETLEEIAIQSRERFQHAGGTTLRYISALNARPDHIQALLGLIQHNLAGWPTSPIDASELAARAMRADALRTETT
jgi:protoporphyrin/coproporphyrin ferrochelatase